MPIKKTTPTKAVSLWVIVISFVLGNWKCVTAYCVFLMAGALGLCFLFSHDPFSGTWCFLLLGIISHGLIAGRKIFPVLNLPSAGIIFAGITFIFLAIALSLYYLFASEQGFFLVLAYSAAFLLPLLVRYSWQAFISIPAGQYPVWYMSQHEIAPVYSTSQPIQLQLAVARNADEEQTAVYPVVASAKLKLGRVFELFVAGIGQPEKSNGIQLVNSSGANYGWQFYEAKLGGVFRRYLDPSRSLMSNKVKPNARIRVVRIAAYQSNAGIG